MEPQGSSSRTQKHDTVLYPKPNKSSSCNTYPHIYLRSILILFSHLRLGPPSGLLPSGFSMKLSTHFCTSTLEHPIIIRVNSMSNKLSSRFESNEVTLTRV
jgi:hypothetical protein